jgi:hypothetical protein
MFPSFSEQILYYFFSLMLTSCSYLGTYGNVLLDSHCCLSLIFRFKIVALLALAMSLYLAAFVVFIYGVLRASRQLHRKLVESVLGTTLRYDSLTKYWYLRLKFDLLKVAGYHSCFSYYYQVHPGYQS